MKLNSSLHNHTTICDGKNTPEEVVEAAIAAGYTDFGISEHSHDPIFSRSLKDEKPYIEKMAELKKRYAGRINLYCGIENEFTSPALYPDKYDYVIGSVHNLRVKNSDIVFCVEGHYDMLDNAKREYYGGDGMAIVRQYYECCAENAKRFRPDIYAHFDVILKLNEGNRVFNEETKEYMDLARQAAEECNKYGGVFEINSGGTFKGNRSFFYPKSFLLEYLKEIGARVMINTDSHAVESIDFGLSRALAEMKQIGFKELTVFENGKFEQKDINLYE